MEHSHFPRKSWHASVWHTTKCERRTHTYKHWDQPTPSLLQKHNSRISVHLRALISTNTNTRLSIASERLEICQTQSCELTHSPSCDRKNKQQQDHSLLHLPTTTHSNREYLGPVAKSLGVGSSRTQRPLLATALGCKHYGQLCLLS